MNVDGTRPDQASAEISFVETPRSHITAGDVVDAAALAGLLAAGVIGVVATAGGSLALAGAILEVAGEGMMAVRSAQNLADLYAHESVISEAGLAETLNVAAPFSKLGAHALNAIYRDLIKAGYEAKAARTTIRMLEMAATGAGGAGLALQLKAILQNLDHPESLKSAVLLAFFLWVGHARQHGASEPAPTERPSGPEKPL